LQPALDGKEDKANKGVANGYASLDASAKVPASQLPAYVDDVQEFANLAAFPATGTTGIIYVALDTNKVYRWGGSSYTEISPSPGSTDAVPEGSINKYYTDERVDDRAAALIQNGVGITWSYDDIAGTLTPTVTVSGGIPEAPTDGALYGRQSSGWQKGVKLAGDTMTGTLVMPGGLSTAPSLTFNSTTTGFSGSATSMILSTGGVQRIQVTSLDVTFTPRISANTGSAGAASIHFGTSNTGFYGGTSISATVGGSNKFTLNATDFTLTVPITLPAAPTADLHASTKKYVDDGLALKASLASPAFTGNPTAPTPTAGDNDTSIATTAFVAAAVAAVGGGVTQSYVDTQDNLRVLKAGDTMTGNLTISKTGPAFILAQLDANSGSIIQNTVGGNVRWKMFFGDGSPEGGGNAGTNWLLQSFSDAGALLATAISINRATTAISLAGNLTLAKASPQIFLDMSGGSQAASIISRNATLKRWEMHLGNGNPETGSNAGSDFAINRFTDAGALNGSYNVLNINRATGLMKLTAPAPTFILDRPDTSGAIIGGQKSGAYRWSMVLGSGAAESGGNAGSDFALNRWDDAGTTPTQALFISRSTGAVTIPNNTMNLNDPAGSRAVFYLQTGGLNNWAFLGDANGPFYLLNRPWSSGVYLPSQAATAWAAYSSLLIKEDVRELNVLDTIDQYRAIRYTHKLTGAAEIGVVAEEINQLYPELVHLGKPSEDKTTPKDLLDPRLSSVTYDRLGPIALQGVKELHQLVVSLTKTVQELQSRIEELQER
jgi:hypothetical protein